jgi:hypothetical protein
MYIAPTRSRCRFRAVADRPRPEHPRLLARRSQFGYVEVNPEAPFASMSKAMIREPEPVSDDELRRQRRQARIRREEQVREVKALFLAKLDLLNEHATAAERRRLRNVRRATLGL